MKFKEDFPEDLHFMHRFAQHEKTITEAHREVTEAHREEKMLAFGKFGEDTEGVRS